MGPDFRLLARVFHRARALHHFYLAAWVFLPDPSADGHCIVAPQYPETISGGLEDWHACPFLYISVLPGCLLWRGLSGTMDPHEQDDRNDLSERVYPTSR